MIGNELIQEVDALYQRYGYDVKSHHPGVRVYVFRSIYNGADVIAIESNARIDDYKREYSEQGYAVKIREQTTLVELEEALFHDFFMADGILKHLRGRYDDFISRLLDKLPDGAEYEYIQSPYDVSTYSSYLDTFGFSQQEGDTVVPFISKLIQNHKGPLLILIEAAAGYGKTCTAYEILNQILTNQPSKVPFFTELSRDRRATIFSHILRKEIEEQFSNRITSKVTLHEIRTGRIPLVIDGFDELIQKDFSFSTSGLEPVESMLSTIVELLKGDAKIIITSRKTAIFKSEEFFEWMSKRELDYSMVKVTITEPEVEHWLSEDRRSLLRTENVPVREFANPVLLSYLRYTPLQYLTDHLAKGESIVANYFQFLLEREQTRQSLLIEPDTQLRIFRKLARIFTEYDVKSASREDLRGFLVDYNRRLLEETRTKYTPDKRPTLDQLGDTLCNHAFLDRKDERTIGFVNEFVLGTLIAESLVMGKYQEHRPQTFTSELKQHMAYLAIQAFRAQPKAKGAAIWDVFNGSDFPYDDSVNFLLDWQYKGELHHNYKQISLEGLQIEDMNFTKPESFDQSVFSKCSFRNCVFALQAFRQCTMVNCSFFNCRHESSVSTGSDQSLAFYGGTSDNGFLAELYDQTPLNQTAEAPDVKRQVMAKFFRQGTLKPRYKQISSLAAELAETIGRRNLEKILHDLEVSDCLEIDGDLGHLTKSGVDHFIEKYGKPS